MTPGGTNDQMRATATTPGRGLQLGLKWETGQVLPVTLFTPPTGTCKTHKGESAHTQTHPHRKQALLKQEAVTLTNLIHINF